MTRMEHVGAEFVDRAEHLARAATVVAAPPEVVWQEVVNNPAGWTEWFPRCRTCFYTAGDGGLGTHRTIGLGPLTAKEIVVTCEPVETWGFCVVDANIPGVRKLYEQLELVPTETNAGPATRLAYTGAFDVARWAQPTARVSAAAFSKAWGDALRTLGTRLDAPNR